MSFDKGVVLFSGSGCASCVQLKKELNSLNIEFTEYNVWKDAEALKFIMGMGLKGIPQLFKNGIKVEVKDL